MLGCRCTSFPGRPRAGTLPGESFYRYRGPFRLSHPHPRHHFSHLYRIRHEHHGLRHLLVFERVSHPHLCHIFDFGAGHHHSLRLSRRMDFVLLRCLCRFR